MGADRVRKTPGRRRWPLSRGVALVLIWVGLAAGRAAPAAEGELPLEYYANLPAILTMALSPSGRQLAVIANIDGRSLVLTKPVDGDKYVSVLGNDNEEFVINWLRWANDDWLLVSVRFPAKRYGVATLETRLVSVAVDGSGFQSLVDAPRSSRSERWVPQYQDRIVDMLPGDPMHVLLALDLEKPGSPGVYRVNVGTAKRKRVHRHKTKFVGWVTDRTHRVRVGVRFDDDEYQVHFKPADSDDWQLGWRYQVFSADRVEPMGFGLDPDVLYLRAYHQGYLAIFKVNLADPQLTREVVMAHPGRDVSGELLRSPNTGDVVGLILEGGRMHLWDAAYEGFSLGLQKAFPTMQVWLLGMSQDETRYLMLATSDREPGTYYVGDRRAGTVSPVGRRYPGLSEDVLSGQRTISYEARDGTMIEGFLTLPVAGPHEDLPAIVLPHGGPIAHDGKGFDYWSEFFANRGYAVLQMNFRGSSGYGLDFMRAGLQNWGLEMQDDVEDAARWLIAEGLADPQRICIVGASYGGYAALMGAIKSAQVFRCAVSFAGVTDLADLVVNSRRYSNSEVVEAMIGDRMRDLRARSPVQLADQVGIPVLLVHGSDDRIVRIKQGRSMHRALTRAGKQHIYIEQEGGNHYLSEQTHRLELFRAMEAFLAEHLAADGGPSSGSRLGTAAQRRR